jgi:mercuric ion binding protein
MKKRTLILLISIFSAGFVQLSLQAKTFNLTEFNIQTIEKKIDTVEIKTSAVCNMCKERLEHNMAFEKGVKSVELDNDTKVLAITYKTNKTNEEELKKAVTKIGYDADELMADQKAHDRLPACCQKGTEPH